MARANVGFQVSIKFEIVQNLNLKREVNKTILISNLQSQTRHLDDYHNERDLLAT